MRDQGKAHFVCVLFLTYHDPTEAVTQISEKRLMLPENKQYQSEILREGFDQGRIF